MSSTTRIPTVIAEFNAYIGNTHTYLQAGTPANYLRLGLTLADATAWSDATEEWAELYTNYINPLTSTSIIVEKIRNAMHDFRAIANPMLAVIAANPVATDDDAGVFNLVLNRNHHAPTHPTTPITATVMTEAKPIGGGDLLVTCRDMTDDSRASKNPQADSVQVAYKIDGTAPEGANDGTTKEIYTKARFLMHLGSENAGKKIYLYFRWYNTKHVNLAGPWSTLQTVHLS